MITKTWNDKELKFLVSDVNSLGELTKKVENLFVEDNYVVCRIIANGENLSEKQEIKLKNIPASSVTTLEVHIAKVDELMMDTKTNLATFLKELRPTVDAVSENFRHEGGYAAHSSFRFLIDSFESVLETVNCISDLEPSARLTQTVGQFNSDLNEILKAYERKDYVLLADLLEYEVSNFIDQLIAELEENSESAATQSTLDR